MSFDDLPEAPFSDWAIDPETGERYHENRLRFNMEIFEDEYSGLIKNDVSNSYGKIKYH